MTDSDTNVIFLDDFDPSISYFGTGWYVGGTPGLEYNGTTHGTFTGGSKFSVSFTGTSISVYGTLAANVSGIIQSSYTLDDELKAFFNAPPNQTSIVYHTLFFASPIVPYGNHTLVVAIEDIGPGNLCNYYLDYLTYAPGRLDATQSSTSSSASLAANTAQLETASNATAEGPSIEVIIPAIIVPICGTLLLLLACVWWLLRRRGADWERALSEMADSRSERPVSLLFGHIMPYPAPRTGSTSSSLRGGSSYGRSDTDRMRGPDPEALAQDLNRTTYVEHARSASPPVLPGAPQRAFQSNSARGARGRTGSYGPVNNPDIPPAYASAC